MTMPETDLLTCVVDPRVSMGISYLDPDYQYLVSFGWFPRRKWWPAPTFTQCGWIWEEWDLPVAGVLVMLAVLAWIVSS